ncbi:hypothetical protein PHYBLDRAFT_152032 [Phycomyces blakesleeanus NRRL 1555(-)]|uniref:Uncharacterized protein n=1 Tax=Phycomyces blakesleeanus (strain ATCC 8743b / DSM 1359 / FGSC 10004 / NBRC 33097 / NRRL 1555) TaxID=763407 RepID=A0A162T7P8_PHYB8|nr:hypothetical protein PHYBLDRAFT_152032 [Phycomyces blakesleeanus NRRL 1555(-)]OAD66762.1 hypothetical protein PHYBLDRAFT_152032 [Phycomyces blakesleeanus NRRL 1555(-)]|eukprot:XP_018284802.1 hypothetical protein PHYBLDRAFT_152032 [Phycomyces blakesleeanus NRRL 1555(-)]
MSGNRHILPEITVEEKRITASLAASMVTNPIPAPIVATILATASTEITAPPQADFAAGPNEPALVQANKNRPRWATTVCFRLLPNQESAKNVFDYLVPKFVGVGMREADLNKYVYTTYCSCKREQNKDREAKKKSNTVSRRHRREKEHFRHRKAAYNKNKIAIDKKMAQDCSALLIREAMSEGESDSDSRGSTSSQPIQILRPGWRSNEYNRLIELVDEAVIADLGNNAHQLLERIWLRTTDSAVPDAIASQLPQWALRNGP